MFDAVTVRKNSFFSFLSISTRLVTNIAVFWGIARYYGPEVFGQFTFAHTIATIFILIADFGFDILLTTEIAKNKENARKLFEQYFSFKILFTAVALILMWVIAFFANTSFESKVLIIVFSFMTIFTTLTNFLYALYRGFEKLQFETKVSLYSNLLLLLAVVFLLFIKADILIITVAFVFSRLVGFLIALKYAYKFIPSIKFDFSLTNLFSVKDKVFIFGLHLVFNYLYFQFDTLLIAFLKDEYEVGIYQSVIKLIMLPLIIPEILINTLTPVLSRLNVEQKESWAKAGKLMNKVLILCALPLSFILYLYAESIIDIIYGLEKYSEAVPILRVFSFIIFIRFGQEAAALLLTTSNRQKVRMQTVIMVTFLNVILNLFMIPKYGAFGAALTSLITTSIVLFIYFFVTKSTSFGWLKEKKFLITLIFSALLWYVFYTYDFNIFIGVPLIVMIFSLIAYFYYFSNEERNIIFSFDLKSIEKN